MEIGIVGHLGIVGGAVKYGLEKVGHKVFGHDVLADTKLQDLFLTEVVFICVPTPANEDFSCNTSIVKSVVSELNEMGYRGVVAVKSTVQPGTTDELREQYPDMRLAFCPEFLRERAACMDFTENHDVCIIGTYSNRDYKVIEEAHGSLPREFVSLSPLEAELTKYFNNIYNATLITFANSFYEVCGSVGADYTKIKNAITKRDHIKDIYLDANENFRGFSGACLPKDTKAIASLVKQKNLNVEFFHDLLKENSKYKATVFDGMRDE